MATYYVDNGGLDSHDGLTPATAWKTVSKISHATFSPGDTILFTAGQTFTGYDLEVYTSGTAGNLVTFGTYGTGQATIPLGCYWSGYNYITFQNLIFGPVTTQMPVNGNGNNVTFTNCVMDGASDTTTTGSIQLGASCKGNNWTFTNCTVHNCGLSGIQWYGDGFTATGNTITDIGMRSPGSPNPSVAYNAHGMYLGQTGFPGRNMLCDSNTIYNTVALAAAMESGISQRCNNGTFTNNTIFNAAIGIDFYESDPIGGGLSVWSNNRIYNTTAAGMYVQGPTGGDYATSESFTIQNNSLGPYLSGNNIDVKSSYTTGTVTISGNWWLVPTPTASAVSAAASTTVITPSLTEAAFSASSATETIVGSAVPFLSPHGISPSSATSSTTATTRLVATGGSVTSSTSRTTAPTLLTGSALNATSVYGSSVYPSDVLPSDELLPGGQIVTAPTLLTSSSSSVTSAIGSSTALTTLAFSGTSVASATGSATSTTQLTPSSLTISRSIGAVTAPSVQLVVVSSGSVSQAQSLTTAPYAVTAGASSVSSSTGFSTAAGSLTTSSLSVSQALSTAVTSSAITSTAIAATSSTSGTTVQQRLSALAAGISQAGSLTTASGQVVPIAGAVSATTTSQINVVSMLVEYAQATTAAGDSVSVFVRLSPVSTSSTKADAYAAVYVVTPILWIDGCEIVILYAYDETPATPDGTDPSAETLSAISINWN